MITKSEENKAYENIATLFREKSEIENNTSEWRNQQIEIIMKSLVLQDLFSLSFKRLLNWRKQTIVHNLHEILGVNSLVLLPNTLSFLNTSQLSNNHDENAPPTDTNSKILKENNENKWELNFSNSNKEFMIPIRKNKHPKLIRNDFKLKNKEEKKE